ncbi:MAG: hypothetical protein SVT52_02995, partial [Planctomycetota bacterium]|nr:hypothetical protein [Planctomycetota bacterium]
MTPKERMLIAMRNGKPDRVPCAPDTSNIIPARMTGKDWWDVFLHRDPPIWKAYNNVVKHFGFDGWNLFGDEGFRLIEPGRVETEKKTVRRTETEIDVQTIYHTPKGDLTETWRYFSKNTPFCIEGKVKDLAADFAKIEYLYPDIEGYDASLLDE